MNKEKRLWSIRDRILLLKKTEKTLLACESGATISARSVGTVLERIIMVLEEITSELESNLSEWKEIE